MSLLTDQRWGEALAHLPDYFGSHVRVSVTALALGLAVSLPLAILSRNRPLLRGALLGLASIVQTVPGLALLALFYPLLLALAAITLSWFGFAFSAFGFLPAVLALALYSMLPVLRNTITGLNGVDAAILEAAQGVGMTPRQSLVMVELPLALPVMMALLAVNIAFGVLARAASQLNPIAIGLPTSLLVGLTLLMLLMRELASPVGQLFEDAFGAARALTG